MNDVLVMRSSEILSLCHMIAKGTLLFNVKNNSFFKYSHITFSFNDVSSPDETEGFLI